MEKEFLFLSNDQPEEEMELTRVTPDLNQESNHCIPQCGPDCQPACIPA
jgi:hypothetical protein